MLGRTVWRVADNLDKMLMCKFIFVGKLFSCEIKYRAMKLMTDMLGWS